DIVGDSWTAMAPLPVNVYEPGAGVLAGKAYIFGGGNPFRRDGQVGSLHGAALGTSAAPAIPYNTSYIYDPSSDSWTLGPPLNTARSFTAGTTQGSNIYAVGGYDGTADTNTVEKLAL